jgi:hypothetical protein
MYIVFDDRQMRDIMYDGRSVIEGLRKARRAILQPSPVSEGCYEQARVERI